MSNRTINKINTSGYYGLPICIEGVDINKTFYKYKFKINKITISLAKICNHSKISNGSIIIKPYQLMIYSYPFALHPVSNYPSNYISSKAYKTKLYFQ